MKLILYVPRFPNQLRALSNFVLFFRICTLSIYLWYWKSH